MDCSAGCSVFNQFPVAPGAEQRGGMEVLMFDFIKLFTTFFIDSFSYIGASELGQAFLMILICTGVADLFYYMAWGLF